MTSVLPKIIHLFSPIRTMALRSFHRFISHRRCPKKHDTIRLIAGDVDVHSGRITGHSLPRQRGHRPFRDDDLSRAPAMAKPPALKNESVMIQYPSNPDVRERSHHFESSITE